MKTIQAPVYDFRGGSAMVDAIVTNDGNICVAAAVRQPPAKMRAWKQSTRTPGNEIRDIARVDFTISAVVGDKVVATIIKYASGRMIEISGPAVHMVSFQSPFDNENNRFKNLILSDEIWIAVKTAANKLAGEYADKVNSGTAVTTSAYSQIDCADRLIQAAKKLEAPINHQDSDLAEAAASLE